MTRWTVFLLPLLGMVSLFATVALISCPGHSPPAPPPPAVDAGSEVAVPACAPRYVEASRTYDGDAGAKDGELVMVPAGPVAIPAEIAITAGAPGGGTAVLSLRTAESQPRWITCFYVGAGDRYRYDACDFGVRAGDRVLAEAVQLHVLSGDPRAGATAVRADVRALCPPAIS